MARDEAMNETRGRGGVCVCWEEMSREEVWGGMCWWNDERGRERERGTDGVLPSTHICIHMRESIEQQVPSGTATAPIYKNSKITSTNIYLI